MGDLVGQSGTKTGPHLLATSGVPRRSLRTWEAGVTGLSEHVDPTRYGYNRAQWDAVVGAGVRILKDVAGLGPRDG